MAVRADVYLGELEPNEVSVQIYHGRVDPKDDIVAGQSIEMEVVQSRGGGWRVSLQGGHPLRRQWVAWVFSSCSA
ncbi:MAG: hypothetical protein V1800_10620 [Candidatus Latescibacterota bacterium]